VEQKYLTILEFPKVLERLASYAAFSASKALALTLQPSPYLTEAQAWQTETSEADHLLSVKVNLGVGGARDVRPYVIRASRNLILMPEELLEVRQTLVSARELQRTIVRMAEIYPRLADIAQRIEECPGVVNAISQAIDDNGQVKDSASPTLARIRRELSVAYGRLMEKLNRIMSSSAQYLQETLITQRGGRYVIPLRAEFKGRVQGIIHDQSGSGATLFIEPLATVELNNKWRQLQLDEENEIQKILVELADLVSSHALLINHTVIALAELDLAFAKAKYAVAIRAVEPILRSFEPPKQKRGDKSEAAEDAPYFKLVAARHPLLASKTVVPIDVTLGEGIRMLVITGPNTGGKTVSLKTIGLLAAMAQAGLRIPAGEGSTLPVFNHILADIGDEQSIEQSLSTFSGHMTNVVHILAQCDEESLAIFDELGAGTDPIEGSALARAILADLLERRVTTFVATHYPELKAFAYTTPGVTNASMEFNTETLSPTYRLLIGLPGASNAFTIAGRLGLTQEIIDQAQTLMSEEDQQVEAMILAMKNQADAAQRLRQEAEAQRQEAENYTRQIEARLKEIDVERQEILNSARADARREIKLARERIRGLETQAQELLKSREAAAAVQPVASEIQKELATLESDIVAREKAKPKPAAPPKQTPKGPVRPGDKVLVRSFGATGEVIAVHDKQAEVQLGRFRTTVALADLERQEQAEKQAEIMPQGYVSERIVEASPGLELDLRGQVAGEAIDNLDQYLDRAFLARLPWVRIIHGKGSGVLRQVVRQALSQHPMVSSYRAGREDEGGDGVTIVTMAVN
jgi:DNA mismatch repair protein MutS2